MIMNEKINFSPSTTKKLFSYLLILSFAMGLLLITIVYVSLGYEDDVRVFLSIISGALAFSFAFFCILLVECYIQRKEELRKQRQ